MRLANELLYEVEEGILAGESLNKLSETLNLGKSTLYYYYKHLKGKRYQEPHVTPGSSELEGEIVGIFAGDGSQYYDKKRGSYQVNVHFGLQNEAYARYVQNLLASFFKKRFRFRVYPVQIRLRIESKSVYEYFKNYLEYVPSCKHATVRLRTHDLPLPFVRGFIRGLFDTDGSIRYNTHDKTIRATYHTTSQALADDVSEILTQCTIEYTRYIQDRAGFKRMYIVRIRTRSVRSFLKTFKPFKEKFL